jgi:ribose 5-phosphate isomerase B
MKIFIASDHAGFAIKQKVVDYLEENFLKPHHYEVVDLGPQNEDRTDYPDFADKVIAEIKKNPDALGILLCGSGQGMAMRANKHAFVRAALCWNEESAKLARAHNDANVLCLGARLLPEVDLFSALKAFLTTPFEGGRHADRVKKLNQPV